MLCGIHELQNNMCWWAVRNSFQKLKIHKFNCLNENYMGKHRNGFISGLERVLEILGTPVYTSSAC